MPWLQLRFDYDPTTTYRARLLPIRRKQKMNMSVFRHSRIVVESELWYGLNRSTSKGTEEGYRFVKINREINKDFIHTRIQNKGWFQSTVINWSLTKFTIQKHTICASKFSKYTPSFRMDIITPWVKKVRQQVFAIASSNIDRLSKLFYWHTLHEIRSKMIIEDAAITNAKLHYRLRCETLMPETNVSCALRQSCWKTN